MAHSTLGAVIALNRRFPLLADAQRRHAWEPRLGERSPRDLAGQCAVIVGMGPIVNSGVSVSDLTIDQLKSIFTGAVTNWKDLGGDDADGPGSSGAA